MTVDATTVLVRYTYAGDANLDGFISGDDYTAIDFNIATAGAFAYGNGDFNYDGIISGEDYSIIDFNIVAQGPALSNTDVTEASPSPAGGTFSDTDEDEGTMAGDLGRDGRAFVLPVQPRTDDDFWHGFDADALRDSSLLVDDAQLATGPARID